LWGAVAICIVLVAVSLWMWLNAMVIQKWVTERASAAIEKRITIAGPVSWTLSPAPTIILKQVSIAEHLDRSAADFAKAGTVEVSIALLPLLHRSIVIPSLAISDLEVVLKPEADEKEPGRRPSTPDRLTRPMPVEPAVQILTIHLSRAAATLASSEQAERVILHQARLDVVPDQPIRVVANGEFRNVPIALDATGGTLLDAIRGEAEWWPLTLSLRTSEATLKVEGNVGLPFGSPRADVQLSLIGERLNELNDLFAVQWPALGPYSLSGRVTLANGTASGTDVKAMLGSSDLTGDVSVQYTGRQRISANLALQRLDTRDLSVQDDARVSGGRSDPVEEDARFVAWLKAWDVDLTLVSRSIIVEKREIGSLRLQAGLLSGLLHISVPQAYVLGMRIDGRAEIDVRPAIPTVLFTLSGRGIDPGLVFSSFSDNLIGLSDVVLNAEARGTTKQALLNSLAISMQTKRATLLFDDPLSKRPVEVRLNEGHASLTPSGGELSLTGHYGIRPFRLRLTTGALSSVSSYQAWPIRLELRSAQASLLVDGTIRLPLDHERVKLAIRAESTTLETFASSLPSIGPFRLTGSVTSNGRESWATKMEWQVGASDGTGTFDIAMQGDRVVVTAQVKSRRLRREDFRAQVADDEESGWGLSDRGSVETPVVPPYLAAHLTWSIDRFIAGPLRMNTLVLEASADSGRLEVSGSARHKHGTMTTMFVLDSSGMTPTLQARAHSRNLNVGALLRDFDATDRVTGTTNLALELSSRGRTIEELVNQVAFQVTAEPHTLRISRSGGETIPIAHSTVTISAQLQAPIILTLQGQVRNLPLSMTVTGTSLTHLLGIPAHLPWSLALRGPDIALEAQGQTGFHVGKGTADFHVHLNGMSLSNLAAVFGQELPRLAAYEFEGDVAVRNQKASLSAFHAKLGKSDIRGGMQIAWNGPRPHLSGGFASAFIEPQILEQLSPPIEEPSERETVPEQTNGKQEVKEAATAVESIGEGVVNFVSPIQLTGTADADSRTRVIPDWALSAQSFPSADLDVHWTVKRLSMPPVQMEDVIAVVTLQGGILTAGPLEFGHRGSVTTGKVTVDETSTVPRAAVEIATTNLDYGGLLKAFKVTNMVEGSADVTLTAEGHGRSLRDLAGTANGHLDIVAGPAKVATRFVELWTSNLMTAMLAQAWHRERFTQYHCAATYIDIHKGEMKTDSLFIDASDHSVAAAGTLDLRAEELDVVVTPTPKDLSVLSLATPIRLTGPLAAPKISTNVQSVAASKAWQVLDIADPIALGLRVPSVLLNVNPGAGSAAENPCIIALGRGGKEALSTKKVVRTGFDWFAKFWRKAGSAVADSLKGH
jgi:uncharacterized protein involved in outer membrane biogenesis